MKVAAQKKFCGLSKGNPLVMQSGQGKYEEVGSD